MVVFYLERLLPSLGVDAVGEGLGDSARPRLSVRAGVQPLLDVLEGSPGRFRIGASGCPRELPRLRLCSVAPFPAGIGWD